MSAPVSDEALHAMLAARADRLSTAAADEVLATARAPIAVPATTVRPGVRLRAAAPATRGSRPRWPWIAAAAAVAIVVGTGLVLQPSIDTGQVVAPSQGPGLPADSGLVLLGEITPDELMGRLQAGELDGRTVILPARTTFVAARCADAPAPGSGGCATVLGFDGYPDLNVVVPNRSMDEAQAIVDGLVGLQTAALRGRDGRLELLGWLVTDPSDSIPVSQLPDLRDGDLALVVGWLFGTTTDHDAFLSGAEPSSEGVPQRRAPGVDVVVDPAAGLGDGTGADLGQYLVGERDGRYDVVARVGMDTVWAERTRSNLAGPTISSADLLSALVDHSLDGHVFAIDGELQPVAWECPLDARPCSRFFVQGLPGVAVTWDGLIMGSSDPAGGGTTSAMAGRLLVVPRHGPLSDEGYLELLGRFDGSLDRPRTTDALRTDALRDPLQLTAVDGWLATGAGVDVTLAPRAPDVGPEPVDRRGPYLARQVASGSGWGWLVVARYDPGIVDAVTLP